MFWCVCVCVCVCGVCVCLSIRNTLEYTDKSLTCFFSFFFYPFKKGDAWKILKWKRTHSKEKIMT